MRRYLDVAGAAEHCGGIWSEWQLRELARTGRIPHRKPSATARLLFVADELDAWLDGAPLESKRLPKGGRVTRPIAEITA